MSSESPKAILVVDSAGEIREAIVSLLEEMGYAAESVRREQEALQRLRSAMGRFGLVLLDVRFVEREGLEFLAELRKDPRLKSLPVVFMSTNHRLLDKVVLIERVECLKKPFSLDQLARVVSDHGIASLSL